MELVPSGLSTRERSLALTVQKQTCSLTMLPKPDHTIIFTKAWFNTRSNSRIKNLVPGHINEDEMYN